MLTVEQKKYLYKGGLKVKISELVPNFKELLKKTDKIRKGALA